MNQERSAENDRDPSRGRGHSRVKGRWPDGRPVVPVTPPQPADYDAPVVIICETPSGCTCGAPADTPAGMHHCDCAVHPGWCGQATCRPCERNGRVIPPGDPQ